MCSGLQNAAEHGTRCTYVGPATPFPWAHTGSGEVEVTWRDGPVRSGAIGTGAAIHNESVLLPLELADSLMKAARSSIAEGNTPIIWAHYLFPYGAAGVLAAGLLRGCGAPVRLWLNPAGSDIWEVGPQLSELATGLLSDPGVDRIVTYSSSFAAELSVQYGVDRPVDVLKPCLDGNGRYRPLSAVDRAAARRRLGLPADAFLISMHSNMRPVKAPEDVLSVARRVAGLVDSREVVLLLAGPEPSVSWDLTPLDIRILGLLRDVTEVLQVSDVELNLSRHDSFNLSLAEAMACGIPVVTTDVVGIAPDIHHCEAGATVHLEPPGPPCPRRRYREVVDALCRFALREDERSAAGRRAGKHAAAVFSGEAHWTRLRSLLSPEFAGGFAAVTHDRLESHGVRAGKSRRR